MTTRFLDIRINKGRLASSPFALDRRSRYSLTSICLLVPQGTKRSLIDYPQPNGFEDPSRRSIMPSTSPFHHASSLVTPTAAHCGGHYSHSASIFGGLAAGSSQSYHELGSPRDWLDHRPCKHTTASHVIRDTI